MAPSPFVRRRARGTVRLIRRVSAPGLGNRRTLFVYLPPSYRDGTGRYPVVYLHDGQNLFDPRWSFAGSWGVDRAMDEAAGEGLEAIVVGIANAGSARIDEYSPFTGEAGGGRADAYLDFVFQTVKPLVDSRFRTLPEPASTGMAGSSMGGLVTLYAWCSRPGRLGFAGLLSPSLWYADRAIFPLVQDAPFVDGRVYLDAGTAEGESTAGNVREMALLLQQKGYEPEHRLRTVIEEGAGHDEAAWGRRFRAALPFLLGR